MNNFLLQKKFYISIFVCFFVFILFADGTAQDFNQQLATIKNENSLYSLTTLDDAKNSLAKALQDVDFQVEDQLVLFVHGRGKHPGKLYGKTGSVKIIEQLEKDYNIKVIAFHWSPSYKSPWNIKIPEQGARNSSQGFAFLLQALANYKKEHPRTRLTLVTHSMGSFVLESYIQNNNSIPLDSLFNSVILSAPASATKNHHTWLEKIAMPNRLYITFNKKDKVLKLMTRKAFAVRLGYKLKDYPLAKNAIYIDMNDCAGTRHQYYIKNKSTSPLFHFFERAIYNKHINLGEDSSFEKKEHDGEIRDNVFLLIDKNEN